MESNTTAIPPFYRPKGVALIAGFGFFAAAGCAVDALVFGGELGAGGAVFGASMFVPLMFVTTPFGAELGVVLSEIVVGAGAGTVGMGLLRLKRWAWVMGVLVVGLNFAFLPLSGLVLVASNRWDFLLVGTVANVTNLVVLRRPEVKKAFNAPSQYLPLFLGVMGFLGVGIASLLFAAMWVIDPK